MICKDAAADQVSEVESSCSSHIWHHYYLAKSCMSINISFAGAAKTIGRQLLMLHHWQRQAKLLKGSHEAGTCPKTWLAVLQRREFPRQTNAVSQCAYQVYVTRMACVDWGVSLLLDSRARTRAERPGEKHPSMVMRG